MEDGIAIPTHLKPELYQIELLPFIIQNNFTIGGKLELTMLCEKESTNVTLHTKNLVLDEENIELINVKNGKRISIIEHSYDTYREFYIAKLSQTLKEGTRYKISINYVTQLTNDNKGFYYDVYEDRTSGLIEYVLNLNLDKKIKVKHIRIFQMQVLCRHSISSHWC